MCIMRCKVGGPQRNRRLQTYVLKEIRICLRMRAQSHMPNHLRSATVRSLLSLILTFLLGPPAWSPLAAQIIPATPAKLNIVIIEGEGAVNNIGQRVVRGPIVQVEDGSRRPVAGASVLFTLPDSGPSGVFAHRARMYLAQTDKAGRAEAKGLRANDAQGKFQIEVRASFRGTTVTSSITQINSVLAGARSGHRKLVAILAGVGAAAAAGVIVAVRSRGANSTPISITPGTGTVGGRK